MRRRDIPGKTFKDPNRTYGDSTHILPADVKPPSAPELEAQVLGAIMMDNTGLEAVISQFKDADVKQLFYLRQHQMIAEVMEYLNETGTPIDEITVFEELKKRNQVEEIGGAIYLSKLSQNVSSNANLEYHMKILFEKKMLREMIVASHQTAQASYEGNLDTFKILEDAMEKFSKILPERFGIKTPSLKDVSYGVMNKFTQLVDNDGKTQYSLGYKVFDELLHGSLPNKVTLMAARSGQGKTTVATNIARNIAMKNRKSLYFALEDDGPALIHKIWAIEAQVNPAIFEYFAGNPNMPSDAAAKNRIIEGIKALNDRSILDIGKYQLPEDYQIANSTDIVNKILAGMNRANEYIGNIFVEDYASVPGKIRKKRYPDREEMMETVFRLKRGNPDLELVIIDNLQGYKTLIEYQKKENIIKDIMQDAKYAYAKTNSVHVLMLAQLKLDVEHPRNNPWRIPTSTLDLQDIENSNIEGVVDNVIYLYRPEAYFADKSSVPDSKKSGNESTFDPEGKMFIIPVKLRSEDIKKQKNKLGINEFAKYMMNFDRFTATLSEYKKE